MYRQTNQYGSYLYSIYTVLGIISHVEMVWQDMDRLNANAMAFCKKNLRFTDFAIP